MWLNECEYEFIKNHSVNFSVLKVDPIDNAVFIECADEDAWIEIQVLADVAPKF